MREIKIRIWDNVQKKMLYKLSDYWIFFEDGNTIRPIQDHLDIQQFTGLYDIFGKEIYEGDVCEITNTWTVFKKEVVFKDACFGFQGTNGMFIPNQDLMEVVGNIYENPELLETKE